MAGCCWRSFGFRWLADSNIYIKSLWTSNCQKQSQKRSIMGTHTHWFWNLTQNYNKKDCVVLSQEWMQQTLESRNKSRHLLSVNFYNDAKTIGKESSFQ